MKIRHVILSSLIGTISSFNAIGSIALADSIKPFIFYADVNNTFIPLSGTSFTGLNESQSILSYGHPSTIPAQFTLTKEHHVYFINSSKPHSSINSFNINSFNPKFTSESISSVRLEKPFIGFGAYVQPTALVLGHKNKLLHGPFYACKMSTDSEVYGIFYQTNYTSSELCTQVNLYLLSENGNELINGHTHDLGNEHDLGNDLGNENEHKLGNENGLENDLGNEHDLGHEPTVLVPVTKKDLESHLPWTFFSKVNETLVELSLKEHTPEVNPKVNAGVGPKVNSKIGPDFKVPFYGNGSHTIMSRIQKNYSIKTDKSTIPNIKIHGHLFSLGSRFPQRNKLKLDEKSRVLNSRYYFCSSVHGINTINDRGFSNQCSEVEVYVLQYDQKPWIAEDHKIGTPQDQNIRTPQDHEIRTPHDHEIRTSIEDPKIGTSVGDQKIVTPQDTKMGNSSGDKQNGATLGDDEIVNLQDHKLEASEAHETVSSNDHKLGISDDHKLETSEDHETRTSEDHEIRTSQDHEIRTSLENKEKEITQNSSITRPLPYLLFAKLYEFTIPLSAHTSLHNGVNYSAMIYGQSGNDPVVFLREGNAAISKDTTNDGYLGIYNDSLAFGPAMPATDLRLDERLRLHNSVYYSCWTFDFYYVITSRAIFSNCNEVELYFEHDDREVTKTGSLKEK